MRPAQVTSARTVFLPFLVALVASLGSLWLSLGMGLKACPLCFYQRSFVMGVAAVLGVGLLTPAVHRSVLGLLVLPMAIAAFGVGIFHEYLEMSGKLECPLGLWGIGTAPQQSLVMLSVLLAALTPGVARRGTSAEPKPAALTIAAVTLGVVLAASCILSAPPMPAAPTKPYATPLDMCRPPFHTP